MNLNGQSDTKNPGKPGCYVHPWTSMDVDMVPKAGLEPARLSPLPPQDSVSTNSTTWAKHCFMLPIAQYQAREYPMRNRYHRLEQQESPHHLLHWERLTTSSAE